MSTAQRERRSTSVELRAKSAEGRTLVGYAAKFNSRALIGDFYEEILPGAFGAAIRTGDPRPSGITTRMPCSAG